MWAGMGGEPGMGWGAGCTQVVGVGYPVGDDDDGVVVGSGRDWAQEAGRRVRVRACVRLLAFGVTAVCICVCECAGAPARARW